MSAPMRESDIQRAVIAHWRNCGLPNTLVAAIPNAKSHGQPGLTPGLFDLIVFAPDLPLALLELKTEKGRLSPAQENIKRLCIRLGIPHAIAYGRDEPIRVLEAWKVVKQATPAL